jgi:hypothetical protein
VDNAGKVRNPPFMTTSCTKLKDWFVEIRSTSKARQLLRRGMGRTSRMQANALTKNGPLASVGVGGLRLLQQLDESRSRRSNVITFEVNFNVASHWAPCGHSLRRPRRSNWSRLCSMLQQAHFEVKADCRRSLHQSPRFAVTDIADLKAFRRRQARPDWLARHQTKSPPHEGGDH